MVRRVVKSHDDDTIMMDKRLCIISPLSGASFKTSMSRHERQYFAEKDDADRFAESIFRQDKDCQELYCVEVVRVYRRTMPIDTYDVVDVG
jgi:hypothetical protein